MRKLRVSCKRWMRRILGLNDSPHSIAWSVSIGMFVAWTPTIGLQMIITFFICMAVRVNRIAGPLMAWVTNPFTLVPIFYFNYLVGSWVMRSGNDAEQSHRRLEEALSQMGKARLIDFLTLNMEVMRDWFAEFLKLGTGILYPLLLGSLLVGLIVGAISYPLTLYAVNAYRDYRSRRASRWVKVPV